MTMKKNSLRRRSVKTEGHQSLNFSKLEPRQLLAGLDGSEVVGLPDDMIATEYVFIGDHSGSNSEKWDMKVGDKTHSAPDFGVVQRDKRDFKKGETYPVTVTHQESTYPSGDEDYDYRAWIDSKARPAWTSGNSTLPTGDDFFTTDPNTLLQKRFFGDATDTTIGKTAQIHFPLIDLDIDSDGNGTVDQSVAEDVAETDSKKGLFLQVYSSDLDNDGTIDNFDFDGVAGLSFSPVKLSLSSNVQHANASQINLTFDYDDAGFTAPDSGLFRLWTKDASQQRTSADLITSGTSVDASSIGLTPGTTVTLYLEAVNSTRRTVNFDPLTVTAKLSGSQIWNGELTDEVFASGIEVDLDATVVSHNAAGNALDDISESSDGAFVPVNADDDDYDASNAADKDQTGAIQGENDLLEIKLNKVKRGGNFRLDIPSHVRVWKAADRTNEVTATTDIDASVDTTLYVEGISQDSGEIKVSWTLDGTTIANGDSVKVTAFQWEGALNVPGHSTYRYKATGALTGSKWVDHATSTVASGNNTADVTLHWAGGPVVGKAVFQVNSNYVWDLDVNVVEVKFKSTGNTATYANSATAGPVQNGGAGGRLIKSSSDAQAMQSEIVVESITGPTVNNAQRGRKFIEVGHVHQATFNRKHGLYDNSTPALRRKSSLEDGKWHWDSAVQATLPWTFTDADHYLNVTSDDPTAQVINNHKFKSFDNPSLLFSDMLSIGGDQVDRARMLMSHRTYIAARAKGPNVLGSNDVLTQLAKLNWSADLDGTINGAGNYSLTGNGVSGGASYSIITDGSRVPDAEANINEAFAGETWSTENQ